MVGAVVVQGDDVVHAAMVDVVVVTTDGAVDVDSVGLGEMQETSE